MQTLYSFSLRNPDDTHTVVDLLVDADGPRLVAHEFGADGSYSSIATVQPGELLALGGDPVETALELADAAAALADPERESRLLAGLAALDGDDDALARHHRRADREHQLRLELLDLVVGVCHATWIRALHELETPDPADLNQLVDALRDAERADAVRMRVEAQLTE